MLTINIIQKYTFLGMQFEYYSIQQRNTAVVLF